MTPEFPIRILFDDGEVVEIDSPEAIAEAVHSLDSDDPKSGCATPSTGMSRCAYGMGWWKC